MIANIVLIALVVCLVLSFIHGMIMGRKKSFVNILWNIVAIAVVILLGNKFANLLMNFNLSPFNIVIEGKNVVTINGFVVDMVKEASGLAASQIQPAVDFTISLVSMALGGVIAIILYFVVQILYIPIRIVLGIFVGRKAHKKHRVAGGFLGIISGVLVFAFFLIPVNGYLMVSNRVSAELKANSAVSSDVTAKMDSINQEYFGNKYIAMMNNSPVGESLMWLFDQTTSAKIQGKDISLSKEANNIGKIMNGFNYLKSVDFNGAMNDSTVELNGEEIASAISSMLSSDLLKTAIPAIKPVIVGVFEKSLSEQAPPAEGEMAIDPDFIIGLMDDLLTGVTTLDNEQLTTGVVSTVGLVKEISSFKGDVNNINFTNIGASFDDIISTGLLSNESVSSFVVMVTNTLTADETMDSALKGILVNVQKGFKDGISSYKKELTALDKLLEIVPEISGGFDIKDEVQGTKIGKIIDEAINPADGPCVIVNESLITDFVVNAINDATKDMTDPTFKMAITRLTNNIKNGGLTYEKEFGVFTEMMGITDAFGEGFSIDLHGKELGAKLDNILKRESKLIDKSFVDTLTGDLIDGIMVGETNDFYSIIKDVKNNLSEISSYETEFSYIGKLFSLSQDISKLSLSNINEKKLWGTDVVKKTLGEKLDEIAPSLLIGNSALQVIDTILANYGEENKDFKDILGEVTTNFADIKENAKMGEKYSDPSAKYTYAMITEAFAGIYQAMSSASKITGSITGSDIMAVKPVVAEYEKQLDGLEDNILLRCNATREIAKVIANNLNTFVNTFKQINVHDVKVDLDVTPITTILSDYIKYLDASTIENEPYSGDTGEMVGKARTNKPFTYVLEQLDQIIKDKIASYVPPIG